MNTNYVNEFVEAFVTEFDPKHFGKTAGIAIGRTIVGLTLGAAVVYGYRKCGCIISGAAGAVGRSFTKAKEQVKEKVLHKDEPIDVDAEPVEEGGK